ncbi:MAG: biopolymer transporter ExbD [Polyangiaceae bacterium]
MRIWSIVLVALAFGLGACSENKVCAPGATQQCFCTDGSKGAQSCAADGRRWEACACSAGGPAGAMSFDSPASAPHLVLGVELHINGDVVVDGKKLANDDAVSEVAKEAFANNKDVRAVVRADPEVQHARVIHVLDLLKAAGITKIAFGTSGAPPAPTDGPSTAPVKAP